MKGWKIIRIPTVSELTDECFDIYSSLRNVLYTFHSIAKNNSSIEVRLKTKTPKAELSNRA